MKAKTAIRYYGKPFDTFPLDDIPGAPLVLCYRVSDLKKYLSRKKRKFSPTHRAHLSAARRKYVMRKK